MANAVVLVVFDGLRPDMVTPASTPNLIRFAALGTWFTQARSVFPSETRVCSASVTTGCQPRRHGLVANRFAHPGDIKRGDISRIVDTGDKAALLAMQRDLGGELLDVPSLGDRLADFVVLSSGTTGQAHVLNPRAADNGQITLSAHGPAACSPAGAALLAELPPSPVDPVARAVWAADVFRARFLPAPPAATVLWLCEPDTSAHHLGLGSPGQMAALAAVDAAFGRILDDWQAGPQRDRLQIIVASDHGHTTVTGHIDVAAAMGSVPEFAGCTLVSGSSGSVWVPGGDPARVAALAGWLARQDWIGEVGSGDHPRAGQIVFTLRATAAPAPSGLPGSAIYDGGLNLGAGTHGGRSEAEMRIVLMLGGSCFRVGLQVESPAGLVDIAPTILHLLGVGGAGMDGRVLEEAI